MYYNNKNIENAKYLRSNMTEAEQKLWYHVRAKRLNGYKFKRQVLIGNYIADFVCDEKKLVIEIDGGQHNQESNIEEDKKRTHFLKNNGYRVIRFWNNDVLNNTESVLNEILRALGN